MLTVVSSPWPFTKWGIDLTGLFPKGKDYTSFVIVIIDYKAEPLAKIIVANTSKFLLKNIICRFDILHFIVSDNGQQFNNKKVTDLCEELGMKKHFSIPTIPSEWIGIGCK